MPRATNHFEGRIEKDSPCEECKREQHPCMKGPGRACAWCYNNKKGCRVIEVVIPLPDEESGEEEEAGSTQSGSSEDREESEESEVQPLVRRTTPIFVLVLTMSPQTSLTEVLEALQTALVHLPMNLPLRARAEYWMEILREIAAMPEQWRDRTRETVEIYIGLARRYTS